MGGNTARTTTTSVLSTWNKFQSGTCKSPPPLEGGTPVSAVPTRPSHQWSRKTPNWLLDGRAPEQLYEETGLQSDKKKRKESLGKKEEMKQERRKQNERRRWVLDPTRQLVSRPHSWLL